MAGCSDALAWMVPGMSSSTIFSHRGYHHSSARDGVRGSRPPPTSGLMLQATKPRSRTQRSSSSTQLLGADAGRLWKLAHGRDPVRPQLGNARDEVVARLAPVAADEFRPEMVPHGRSLRREQQPVDAGVVHALELAAHGLLQLFVADIELRGPRPRLADDLPGTKGLKLRGRRGVVCVGVDDQECCPPTSLRAASGFVPRPHRTTTLAKPGWTGYRLGKLRSINRSP